MHNKITTLNYKKKKKEQVLFIEHGFSANIKVKLIAKTRENLEGSVYFCSFL